ncbi:dTDP-4-dehydrorhamnose reductase [Allomuricauda sp. NBRC 101325]|uniref:dTDP-4-dehydrorhamnose reductase n=1 Tax=Allomuricauda sp. NBRC 101325 TaxID=1113758 RepID=UPI0024A5BB2B|nr:dTDP-4-dehydrorhamnose reductase [Muricauda sp. NBRC 101325]GLU43214.1 NAD(P)-dependent oxidoreductase [Muricauda sp. NBRC 101325]
MFKILVTGSDGQLGRTIKDLGHKFKELEFDFKNSSELDITDEYKINDLFSRENYDYCINCAAYTNVEQAEKTPEQAFKINSEAVKQLAFLSFKYNIVFIHISTDYVFDGTKLEPYIVGDETNPINEYGKSKLFGEENIRQVTPNHFILRTSWLYSKKFGHNFYRTILSKAKKGAELRITDEQYGCPTNTQTLAKYIIEEVILGDKEYGTYHVTDGKPMTWFDFANQILLEHGLDKNAQLVLDRNYRTFAKRPKNSVLN